MLYIQAFYAIFFFTQVLIAPNEAESRRPIWNIAHMVNALHQIDYYLDMGANGLEFDISFSPEGKALYTFHGIPCDCFRSCLHYENFITYLQYLQRLTTPGDQLFRKELVLLLMDFKVRGLSSAALTNAGEDVAMKMLDYYWLRGKSNQTQAYIVVSLPSTAHVEVMKSFLRTLQNQNASEYIPRIGLDFSGNEDLHIILDCLERSGYLEKYWLGDGITNCLGRSTKRLLSALNKRDEHEKQVSKVYWWTVDRQSTMRRVIRLGVDGMITNYPENLFKVLKEDPFRHYARLATLEDSPWKKHVLTTEMSNSFRDENSTFYEKMVTEEILYN
ncbi:dermonecrotic toxin StSicTox-betaIB1i-like isoform X1 [Argiope bruennichi]|uniref:dermonecrotic toxin StSicTox-betaIB1i-like isoform X1 n=1 Tax=Argiope bruennichi TaxID=94029 RepID=UPI0024951EA6|nr:dermonecrotic toxin StSicTox-betaIB1i-like isoform X1 [Argiope bruennichi]